MVSDADYIQTFLHKFAFQNQIYIRKPAPDDPWRLLPTGVDSLDQLWEISNVKFTHDIELCICISNKKCTQLVLGALLQIPMPS